MRSEASTAAPTGFSTLPEIKQAIRGIEAFTVEVGEDNDDLWTLLNMQKGQTFQRLSESGPKVVPEIRSFIFNPKKNHNIKLILCMLLANVDHQDSANLLKQILLDKSMHIGLRSAAGQALAELRWPNTGKMLEEIVEDEANPLNIRRSIMGGFAVAGYDNVDWLKNIATGGGFKDKDKLLSMDEGAGIMWNAMRALGLSTNPKATNILIELQEKNPNNGIVTEALRNRKDIRAVPILIKVLKSNREKITTTRTDAAIALGELKAKEAVEPLIEVVKTDKDIFVIWRACEALSEIGDKRALPVLQTLVENIYHDSRFSRYIDEEKQGYGFIISIKKALERLKG